MPKAGQTKASYLQKRQKIAMKRQPSGSGALILSLPAAGPSSLLTGSFSSPLHFCVSKPTHITLISNRICRQWHQSHPSLFLQERLHLWPSSPFHGIWTFHHSQGAKPIPCSAPSAPRLRSACPKPVPSSTGLLCDGSPTDPVFQPDGKWFKDSANSSPSTSASSWQIK